MPDSMRNNRSCPMGPLPSKSKTMLTEAGHCSGNSGSNLGHGAILQCICLNLSHMPLASGGHSSGGQVLAPTSGSATSVCGWQDRQSKPWSNRPMESSRPTRSFCCRLAGCNSHSAWSHRKAHRRSLAACQRRDCESSHRHRNQRSRLLLVDVA